MKVIVLVAVYCFASTFAQNDDYGVYEAVDGQQWYLVPLVRQTRQTKIDVDKSGAGTRVTLGHSGTIFKNDDHRLDGGAFASKQFHPSGPVTAGGNLDYQHLRSGSGVRADVAHTGSFGTDLGVQGNANIWRHGNSRLDGVGQYSRHFGGPGGTGRPDYYGGIKFTHRF